MGLVENKSQNNGSLSFQEVGEYINSQRFIELLAQYNVTTEDGLSTIAGRLIGVALDYADIFRNSEEREFPKDEIAKDYVM